MVIRAPAVAGSFYPAAADACRQQLDQQRRECATVSTGIGRVIGGIVPHAGWMCSGAVATSVFTALAVNPPETIVLFGAVHRPVRHRANLFGAGQWQTPLGPVTVDAELADAVTARGDDAVIDDDVHVHEHSIEVQVPMIRHLMPGVMLLPIMTPPHASAPQVGEWAADAAAKLGRRAAFVGSTDLTHYGPRYGFTPMGIGQRGVEWARSVNDRRMIDLMLAMRAGEIVREAAEHMNACGSGAIAATIAACRAGGADRATLLQHTNSAETLAHLFGADFEDAVGYAGIVFTAGRRDAGTSGRRDQNRPDAPG